MADTRNFRAVAKKFYGTDPGLGDRWFERGEVVDLNEMNWPNTAKLDRSVYLRKLEFGEEPVQSEDGRWWMNETLAVRHPGSRPTGERASSPGIDGDDPGAVSGSQDESADEGAETGADDASEDAAASAEGDEDAGAESAADGVEDEDADGEEEDDDELPEYELDHIGGGWYHIKVDGEQVTQQPVGQGEKAAHAWARENL